MASSIFSNYINGAWVEGASSIVNRSPADTEDVVGRYAQADADQVDRAIAAAAAQPAWRAAAGGTLARAHGDR